MGSEDFVVIVGCGRLGARLANQLNRAGHPVIIIDRSEDAFQKLALEFNGSQLVGDALELPVLEQARAAEAMSLLAATSNDNVNLMVAQVAKTVFNVRTVLARVYDPGREGIFSRLGIETVCPTLLASQAFLKGVGDLGPRAGG